MQYRREIDGLRALAVLPVMLFHAGFSWFSGGYVGVDVFFVISGYLITTIILAEMEAGTFSVAAFYERRARRILPALFFVMAVTLPLAFLWLLPREMKEYARSLIAVPLFISNILFWKQSGYFDTGVDGKPLIHTWSLAVEEQFYIFFPLLVLVSWRFGRKNLVALIAMIGTASLVAAQAFSRTHPDASFYLLHTRAWELIIGALCGFYVPGMKQWKCPPRAAGMLGVTGLLMIIAAVFCFSKATPFPGLYALLPTVGAALIILFARADNFAGRLLGWRPLVGLGLISYSAYLWHQPLFVFARTGFSAKNGSAVFIGLIAATMTLAYLSWRFIEQPFRDRRRFQRSAIFSSSLACSVLILAIGIVGHRTSGGYFRYDQQQMDVLGRTEEMGKYVWHRADDVNLKEFAPGRRKILVIGDSMGADLVNVVSESPFISKVSMSFHTIDYACGNLYLKESFVDHVDPAALQSCRNRGWYDNPKLKQLMREADQVWLVSVWVPWQVERLDNSLHNLNAEFGDKFLVFSRKSFGKPSLQDLSAMTLAQRRSFHTRPGADVLAINTQLQSTVASDHYLDLSKVACAADMCPVFNQAGELLSFDGDHLTRAGARYMAQKLSNEPRFVHALLGQP